MEGEVANGKAIHAIARAAGEQAVLGVFFDEDRVGHGRLAESVAGDDELIQFLYVPARVDEFEGEPIEKGGVAGKLALGAEVLRCFDEADAHHALPHAVDDDSGGDGVTWRNDPLC